MTVHARSNPNDLVNETLVSVTALPGTIAWRQNVGRAQTRRGSVVQFGVPGQADIMGVRNGYHFEIECKSGRGRQTKDQRNWQDRVCRAGAVYIVGRDPEQAARDLIAATGGI